MPKRSSEAPAPRPVIRPRHEILGVDAGKAGYRRGCKCDPCRAWNAKRMREYRAKKRAETDEAVEIELPATPEAPLQFVLLKDLEPGDIYAALIEELPAADGAYIFQRTVSAMAMQAARVLDNADRLGRLELISSMQIRILDALKRLEPPRSPSGGAETGPTVEDIVNAITGGRSSEGGE